MEDEHLWFRTGPREMTALSEICFIPSFLRGLQLPGEAADIWGLGCITAFCVRALLLLCVCDSTARCTLTLCLPELLVLDRCCHHPALLTELCNLSPWELPRYTNTTEEPALRCMRMKRLHSVWLPQTTYPHITSHPKILGLQDLSPEKGSEVATWQGLAAAVST